MTCGLDVVLRKGLISGATVVEMPSARQGGRVGEAVVRGVGLAWSRTEASTLPHREEVLSRSELRH